MTRSAYEVLGVAPGAHPAEIHAAYRVYVRRHHPDVGGDPARFQVGADAYMTLITARRVSAPANVRFHKHDTNRQRVVRLTHRAFASVGRLAARGPVHQKGRS